MCNCERQTIEVSYCPAHDPNPLGAIPLSAIDGVDSDPQRGGLWISNLPEITDADIEAMREKAFTVNQIDARPISQHH